MSMPTQPPLPDADRREVIERHESASPVVLVPGVELVPLVTAGVDMDGLGIAFSEFTEAERKAVVDAHPRPGRFKEEIIQAFYDGIQHKPETTFGNVKADVLADRDPSFRPENFCRVIRASAWPD